MAVKDRAERADRVHVNLAGVSALAMGHFLGGFLMSAGQLMGKLAPFGAAAVAAVPGGLNGASTLAGAALGYLVTGPLEWGIQMCIRDRVCAVPEVDVAEVEVGAA